MASLAGPEPVSPLFSANIPAPKVREAPIICLPLYSAFSLSRACISSGAKPCSINTSAASGEFSFARCALRDLPIARPNAPVGLNVEFNTCWFTPVLGNRNKALAAGTCLTSPSIPEVNLVSRFRFISPEAYLAASSVRTPFLSNDLL